MQMINLKWLLFPYWLFIFFPKFDRVQAVDDIDKLCKFHENLTTNGDFLHKQEMQIFNLKWLLFPCCLSDFFSKSI